MLRLTSWSLRCLVAGTMGLTGFYADALKPYPSARLAVGILMLPVSLVILIGPGDAPERWVARLHEFAAGWYAALTLLTVGLAWRGYAP